MSPFSSQFPHFHTNDFSPQASLLTPQYSPRTRPAAIRYRKQRLRQRRVLKAAQMAQVEGQTGSEANANATLVTHHDSNELQPTGIVGGEFVNDGAIDESSHVPASAFSTFSKLLKGKNRGNDTSSASRGLQRDIGHAPLLLGGVVAQHANDLLPQYGLLGGFAERDPSLPTSQVFLNTNVPFSSFICGVQGSGKSHTTACILENALIPSPNLGELKEPVSAIVLSYGEWSSGGAGFNISEAISLATAADGFPDHQVKKITVMTSPSNPAINKFYERKNVKVMPFKLRANTLDISALHTLMAVDDKSNVPLYMAKVEAILRDIVTRNKKGALDYNEFKKKLALEKFDSQQSNMLEMRLNLLESFLDWTNKGPEPAYAPGEIVILDFSDPFITPTTACVLFKLGLERFLNRSSSKGKMVVLDEAHKYMLNNPGSKILTEYLTRVIRLQRHKGARVVISTQEPTVSTDLIALCSVTVMHRFTSPTWYHAVRRHIHAVCDDDQILQEIEGLETGEALVYAPNSVLGKNQDGSLIKATGQVMKIYMRDRVTSDGGESVMAV